jgi:hypothetical protein
MVVYGFVIGPFIRHADEEVGAAVGDGNSRQLEKPSRQMKHTALTYRRTSNLKLFFSI